MVKVCIKCGDPKPRSEFYRHPKMADGLLGKCKACSLAYAKARRQADPVRVRAINRVSYAGRERTGSPKKQTEASRRARAAWIARNPEKRAAHGAVSAALESGRLTKPGNCETCGEAKALHGHHDDYSQPLVVRWLCAACHSDWHRKYDLDEDRSLAASKGRAKREF